MQTATESTGALRVTYQSSGHKCTGYQIMNYRFILLLNEFNDFINKQHSGCIAYYTMQIFNLLDCYI